MKWGYFMKVLVTAGDTYEAIDDVRKITHMATGRLGCLIADEFAFQGAQVTLICGEHSQRPALRMNKIVEIKGVISLQETLKELMYNSNYDCVVHSMAVSDYTVRGLATEDDIVKELMKVLPYSSAITDEKELYHQVKQAINNALYNPTSKISSDYTSLAVFMDRAPKIISSIKEIRPYTTLVGFKLLSNVDEKTLLEAAKLQMHLYGSDLVLANDLADIDGDNHKGLLISKDGIIDRPLTKQDIAKSIVTHVTTKIRRGYNCSMQQIPFL